MTLHTAIVKIEEEKISSEKAKNFILSEENGAESIFVGRVRKDKGILTLKSCKKYNIGGEPLFLIF